MKDIQSLLDPQTEELPVIEKEFITLSDGTHEVLFKDGETLETSCFITILNRHTNASEMFETKYGKAQKALARINKQGLAPLVDKYSFTNYEEREPYHTDLLNAAREFYKKRDGWFVVLGQSGIGKTHICIALSSELIKWGKNVGYKMWMEDIEHLKYHLDEVSQYIEETKRYDVLYIDDFLKTRGDTEPTDKDMEIAFMILDARYRENLPTIISSEKTIEQIREFDHAVAGRITEMTKGKYLMQVGKDIKRDERMK